jgi:hypothetical protein
MRGLCTLQVDTFEVKLLDFVSLKVLRIVDFDVSFSFYVRLL